MSIEYDAANYVKTMLDACQEVTAAGITTVIDTEDQGAYTTAHAIISPLALTLGRISADQMHGSVTVVVDVYIPPAVDSKATSMSAAWDLMSEIRQDIVTQAGVHLTGLETSRPTRLDSSVDMDGWITFGISVSIIAAVVQEPGD